MNADQKLKAIQTDLDADFQKRMAATPNDASLETWQQSRALAYAAMSGRIRYELGQALYELDRVKAQVASLQAKLDATGYHPQDAECVFFGNVDGVPVALDSDSETGAITCVYIAGQWVEPEFFSAKAHAAWEKQREAFAASMAAEEVAA